MPRIPLSSLAERTFDVVVVGGGVNGCSAAQHLAAAGYSVLLVDKGDYACGSSGYSSRILHCGLRYLATGSSPWDIARRPRAFAVACRMARQAMQARDQFVEATPERVRPFTLCFPIHRDGPYAPWQFDAAFRLLAMLGRARVPLDYRRLGPREATRGLPFVRWLRDPDALRGVATFREYQFEFPERIVIDTLLDAEALGAVTRNYTPVLAMTREAQESWALRLGDALDPHAEAVVHARIVLNTAGIWIDRVNGLFGVEVGRKITGTKGVHAMVQLPPECRDYGVATFGRDLWPFYCMPWRGMHYFGPTETLYEGDLDDIRATEDEIAWVIDEANRLFPGLDITRSNVLFTWACVRPLTYDPDLLPHGRRSREIHDLGKEGMPNVFAITAGPIMTHRSAGAALCRKVRGRLKPSRPSRRLSFRPRLFAEANGSPPLLEHDATVRLTHLRDAAAREQVSDLVDLLFRRVGAGWSRTMAFEAAPRAAEAVAEVLGWKASRVEREVARYRLHLEHKHGVTKDPRTVQPVKARNEALRCQAR